MSVSFSHEIQHVSAYYRGNETFLATLSWIQTQPRRFQSRDKQSRQRQVRKEIIDEQSSHSQSSTSGGMEDDSRYRTATFRASISAGLTTEAELHEHIDVESATSGPLSRITNETPYPDYSSVSAPVQLTLDKLLMILQLAENIPIH
ncbi:hypothetical protein JG688_00014458 [Phytophthora aleatoria]|uniref:Uncharacterized protein n=1 Tax=Phytophthora aleatoria TaxID=2496075 RepID=A0A8J5IBV5_9STRA|nr:hypothetical protein JG688_00014458 [Phytophthora aleatoria]